MIRYRLTISSVFAASTILAAAGFAAGQQVPFHGTLVGTFTSTPIIGTSDALVHAMGTGQAAHLGQFSFDFPLTVNLISQTGSGIYTLTAANGDTVRAYVKAKSSLLPNGLRLVQEVAIINGGTGRFTNATGGYISERWLDRNSGDVIGYFDGTITSPGAAKQ